MNTGSWSDGRPRQSALSKIEGSMQDRAQSSGRGNARQAALRWLKFNFVGGIGIGVQLAALTLFRSALHIDYMPATGLAVEAAVIHNFLWHERFTWRDRPSGHRAESLTRFLKFNVSNGAVSIVGNLLIMRAVVGGASMNYVASNLAAIAVCSVVNLLLSDRLVFSEARTQEDSLGQEWRTCKWKMRPFWGLRPGKFRAIIYAVLMRSRGSISLCICWIEGRACPRRYLSFLPSRMRANLFGSD